MKNVCLSFLMWFALSGIFAQVPETGVEGWIREGNLSQIKKNIKGLDTEALYGDPGKTLLHLAVENNQYELAKYFLKKGADPDRLSDGKNLLILTSIYEDAEMLKLLIRYGAEVNVADENLNTPLIYSSYLGNEEIVRILVEKGADLGAKSKAGKTPLDYAIEYKNAGVSAILRSLNAPGESVFFPDYLDGPHFVWPENSSPYAFYMYRDSAKNEVDILRKEMEGGGPDYRFKGLREDSLSYLIHTREEPAPEQVSGVSKVFVVGDVHGSCRPVEEILTRYGVMDAERNWTWDKGHLVFMGDVFDRGEEVTRLLWLIYGLEQQAKKAGGQVHLILGNHEWMAMNGDQRDLAIKYFYLCSSLGLDYAGLFTMETELGRWLRNKPLAVRIDSMLFVHAGISSLLAQQMPDITVMNDACRLALHHPSGSPLSPEMELLTGELGPLWYRGYFFASREYPRADMDAVESILKTYGVRRIVIGHSNVREITPMFEGRVIATDVPFYNGKVEIQALLLENGRMYRLRLDGRKEEIREGRREDL